MVRKFFFERANLSLKKAEQIFAASIAFVSSANKPDARKQAWVERVGAYKYYSYILGNFNPVKAQQIYKNPADVIAEAFVSQMCYNFQESE